MAENVEELGSEETPQTRDVTRSSSPSNFSVEDLRDGSNIFTLVMNQLHTIAESVNDLNQRLSALEQLQGRYGNVVADSVDAQSVKVGGVDVVPQGGDYAPKNHASPQTTYGQATTSNYGHAKLSNDTLNANSTGSAGVACSTGHKHSQYLTNASASAGSHINEVGTPNVSVNTSGGVSTFTFNYLKGEKGNPGTNGTNGTNGTDGTDGTKWFVKNTAPTASDNVKLDDLWLDTDDNRIYKCTQITELGSIGWTQVGQIVGAVNVEFPSSIPANPQDDVLYCM